MEQKSELLHIGETVEIKQNEMFFLDKDDHLKVVISGKLNLFYVKVVDGETVGPQMFFLQLEAGDAFFGLNFKEYGQDYTLIAKGHGEIKLNVIKQSKLLELHESGAVKKEIELYIKGWIRKLSSAVTFGHPPDNFTVPEEKIIELDENGSVKPEKPSVIWVKQKEGELFFLGDKNFLLKKKDAYFPVTEKTWVLSGSKNSIEVSETGALLTSGFYKKELDGFHGIVAAALYEKHIRENEAETSRLRVKVEKNVSHMRQSLGRLATVLNPVKKRSAAGNIQDPLFKACSIVGNEMGMEVKPYPELLKNIKVNDPLRRILEVSKLRSRDVVLRDGWWETDIGGPLLAYIEEGEKPVAIVPEKPGQYSLYNPETNSEAPITADMAMSLKGIAKSFYRPFPDKKLTGKDLFRFGAQGLKNDFATIISMGVLAGLLGMLVPLATGMVFDTIIPDASRGQLFQMALALIAFALAKTMFQVTRAVAQLRVEGKMNASVQAAVWDRLLTLPVPFFRDYSTGDLVDRAMGINGIRQAISGIVLQSGLMLISSSFNLVLLFYYDFKLALVGIALIAVALVISATLSYLTIRHQRKLAQIGGDISGMVLQFINGVTKIKVAGAESRFFNLWSVKFALS